MTRRKKVFTGQVNDLDLRLLRVFTTVIECGGLSAAQTALGVGRSTISKQISDLETRIGARLCHRGRRGFALTQQGRQVLFYAKQLFDATEDFQTHIASINERLVGQIKIGMIDYSITDAKSPLLSTIKQYRKLAPEVTISIMTGTPSEVERGVIDGDLHVGIIPDYQRLPGLQYDILYEEEVGLFCGGDHPIAQAISKGETLDKAEVEKHELVYRSYYESGRLRNLKQQFPQGTTVYQTEAVLALVQSGIHLGFFPTHCLSSMSGQNYEILPDVFRYKTPHCAIYRIDRQDSTILHDFITLLSRVKFKLTAQN